MLVIRSTQRMMIEIVLERASRAKSRRQQQADHQAEEAEDQDDEEGRAVQRQPQLSDGQPLGRASFGADRDSILSSPSAGDEKYWAQIRYAYRMLSDSIGSELALSEAVNRGQTVLEPIFRDAILAQEVDRVNAVTMLAVLRELVTRADGETQTSRHAVDDPTVALAPKRPRQDEFWEQTGEEGRASEHEVNE
ncbi:unnamed protein product, partial [Polarella glacialis]